MTQLVFAVIVPMLQVEVISVLSDCHRVFGRFLALRESFFFKKKQHCLQSYSIIA